MNQLDFAGRTAVVTGGAQGIGAAIVERLRAEGLDVVGLDLVDGFDVSDTDAWEDVAEAVWRAASSEGTGEAWVVQPGLEPEPYRFRGVPGPRVAGAEGMRPP